MPTYKDRIIGFVDILGWSDLVDKSAENEQLLKSVDSVAALIAELSASIPRANEISKEIFKEFPFYSDQQEDIRQANLLSTHFSDTLVFSATPNIEAASLLVACVMGLTIKLMCAGYYVRGVISKGELHHTANSLYGPALIAAYRMEQKCAIYPRVLVTADVLDYMVKKEWVEKDVFDGMHFLNVLHLADAKCIATIEAKLADNIATNISKLEVLQKLNWLKNYLSNHKSK